MSVFSLSHYDYFVPTELIAQEPLENRAASKMLVVNRKTGELLHRQVRDLPEFLSPKDAMVLNDTKVVPARLVGVRDKTGGRWEGLFLRVTDIYKPLWQILSKTRGSIQSGETISLRSPTGKGSLSLEFVTKQDDTSWIVKPILSTMNSIEGESRLAILDRIGWVPLPPYIRRGQMTMDDVTRYQTVFAAAPGAVAAPTAGLHFTTQLLNRIREIETEIVPVTLHVGIGTFKPIETENIQTHKMHSEWGSLCACSAEKLRKRRENGGRIIAIGTTSVRVLESAAQESITKNPNTTNTLIPYEGETSLFIRPPYLFKNVDVLFTNFHFPKSTLLILVRTFGG
ncbi:MAG: tRNA preQ1(34) S-adenosylmethionine ribosyltransferase-isomerase QueA, partial [Thermoguttaceae bacterium]